MKTKHKQIEEYKGYYIQFNPKPIPTAEYDWDYWHDDYDGADDSNDPRCGTASCIEACQFQIDTIKHAEQGEEQ